MSIAEAADSLFKARTSGEPCAPIRGLVPSGSIADAYEIQRINMERALASGRRRIGWKIGLTNPAVQRQLGVGQPDFGPLYADAAVNDGLPIPWAHLMQPRLEAEVAFVLDRDLTDAPVTATDVVRGTAFVLPAIEIVGSRIANWDITILDTIADDASSSHYVVGPKPTMMDAVDLYEVRATLSHDGKVVSGGTGADCLGHPVNAVVWLADTLLELGEPLRAGDLVLSGALGPMVDAMPGATFEASITGLGTVRAVFSEKDDS